MATLASSAEIKPQEQGSIKTSLSTHGKMGKSVSSISVMTNDPVRPEAVLFLNGTIY